MCKNSSIDFKERNPTELNEFSKITVFEEQVDSIPTIAEISNRFSGRHAEEYIHMAGASCDGQAVL